MTAAGKAFSKKKMIGSLLGFAALAPLIYLLVSRWIRRRNLAPKIIPQFQSEEQGLTESDVFARRTDARILARQKKEKAARKERLRKRIFSILNLTILVFAISLLLLRDFWGAVGTLGALIFNISVNTFQETRAARQMQELARRARPYATVIRAGRLRYLNLDDVVIDDVLVAGQGDEILADGTLLEGEELQIDETTLGPLGGVVTKQTGDLLRAGSFCISGWAVYRAQSIPIDENINHQNNLSQGSPKSLTPLQSIVMRTLYALLFITALFYGSIVLEILQLDKVLRQENLSTYRNVLSIIFNIAPGGLFFMIVINYAVGSADIARIGALVRSSLMVESMAQMTTICLIRRGSLSGLALEVAMIEAPSGAPVLTENRARRILGDFAHTASSNRFPMTTLKGSLEGQMQPDVGQAPYLSINGWQAVNFKTRMITGSYVLGYPDILQPYFSREVDVKGEQEKLENESHSKAGIGNFVRRIFRRNNSDTIMQDEKVALEVPAIIEQDNDHQDLTHPLEEEHESKGVLKKTKAFLSRLTRRGKQSKVQTKEPEEQREPEDILRLVFAYSPDPQPLFDHNGRPQCPKNLIPICSVHFVEEVRPEVQEAVKVFQEAGVDIKVLSEDEPNKILAVATQVGLIKPDTDDLGYLTADNLLSMDSQALGKSILEKSIFAQLNSEQMARIVELLHIQGEYVGVVGNSSADFHIMRQGKILITSTGSDPRLMSDSDILLTKNSLEALPGVLRKGQQIVNGTLDVLKLNLNQILYLLFLLASMFIAGERTFYYTPAQGSAIGIFTVVFPSIGLSLWATAKAVNRSNMHQQLVHFVTPAAIMTTIFARLVHSVFSSTTFNIEYTHLAVTHLLVSIGLLLVLFVKPPLNPTKTTGKGSRDWRMTIVVATLFFLFHIATVIPLAQQYLMIGPLASVKDYLFIWGMSLVWAALVLIIWRLRWLQRVLDWSARWLAPNPQTTVDSDKVLAEPRRM
jgi:magnesium-transporting ATPase (P-type)